MRSACPPIMYGCKYLNFSRSTSEMDLIARRAILKLEGEAGTQHIEEYLRLEEPNAAKRCASASARNCISILWNIRALII